MPATPRRDLLRRSAGSIAALALAAILPLSGCSSGKSADAGQSSPSAGGTSQVNIGVVFQSNLQPRWRHDAAAMEDEAAQKGYKLTVKYADGTAKKQTDQIEAMISQGVNVLIINAVDAQAMGVMARKARDLGIKVISYDQAIAADVDLNTSRSLRDTGTMQIQSAVAAVPKGKYALIRGDNSHGPNAAIFNEQYQAELAKHPEISVVYSIWTKDWNPTTAQDEAEAALLKNPDIDAFVVSNDGMAAGVVQALRSVNRDGKVFVTGLDAYEENLHLIYEGKQGMTVFTDIEKQARNAVNSGAALVRGEKLDGVDYSAKNGDFKAPYLNAPIISVTKNNLCDFFKIAPKGWADPKVVFGGPSPCQ